MITTNWILAICAIISIPISIWAAFTAKKNDKIIQNFKSNSGLNIGQIGNMNNNGEAIHYENMKK